MPLTTDASPNLKTKWNQRLTTIWMDFCKTGDQRSSMERSSRSTFLSLALSKKHFARLADGRGSTRRWRRGRAYWRVTAVVRDLFGEGGDQAVRGLTIAWMATNAAMAKTSQAKARCSRWVGSRVAIRPAAREPATAARMNAAVVR